MHVDTLTGPSGGLLSGVRRVLADADEVMLCVAFAQGRGVHLLRRELDDVAKRGGARVLVTTTFGSTTEDALASLTEAKAAVRVLNPGGSSYHPKVYLGRRGHRLSAVVASVNLTSGLAVNVEAATLLQGTQRDEPLAKLWSWADALWRDPRTQPWKPTADTPREELIDPELFALLVAATAKSRHVYTLGPTPKDNVVQDLDQSGLWVHTDRTREQRSGPQLVEPRMLNLAWDTLKARGQLTNTELLNDLRVHRSSFVCAILNRLPNVTVTSKRPITLRYEPSEAKASSKASKASKDSTAPTSKPRKLPRANDR
jgi:hypothetical protein